MKFSLIKSILLFVLISPLSLSAKHVVIIDPGHGGEERGATNGKYEEATLALQVSKKIYNLLKKTKNLEPHLTRANDTTLTLPQRVYIAQSLKADLFVSIHINSSTNSKAQGGEVYIRNELKPHKEKAFLAQFENGTALAPKKAQKSIFSQKSRNTEIIGILENINETFNLKLASLLAKDILNSWGGTKRLYHNRIHQAPFYVVKHTKMPSILVELGFISNASDVKKLSTQNYQNKLAKGVVKGISNYFKRLDQKASKNLYSKNN